jgi:hypothetical protein
MKCSRCKHDVFDAKYVYYEQVSWKRDGIPAVFNRKTGRVLCAACVLSLKGGGSQESLL